MVWKGAKERKRSVVCSRLFGGFETDKRVSRERERAVCTDINRFSRWVAFHDQWRNQEEAETRIYQPAGFSSLTRSHDAFDSQNQAIYWKLPIVVCLDILQLIALRRTQKQFVGNYGCSILLRSSSSALFDYLMKWHVFENEARRLKYA